MSLSTFVRRALGLLNSRPQRTRKSRALLLFLERLEDRDCPADVWVWVSPAGVGDTSWVNHGGKNWDKNGVLAAADTFPGKVALDDEADFSNAAAQSATLDAPLTINKLSITNWVNTLTLNNDLIVSGAGGMGGVFVLSDSSTISIAAGKTLWLTDIGGSWSDGTITGPANSHFVINGSALSTAIPMGAASIPDGLGANMTIQSSAHNGGSFTVTNASGNLPLTGTSNTIEVGNGGTLNLNQHMLVAGQQNTEGGISLDAAHTGTLAVQVDVGGTLLRSDSIAGVAGVLDQVGIEGAVYNLGGLVKVDNSNDTNGSPVMLYLIGKDAANYSYWQKTGAAGKLFLTSGANIDARGTYQIDIGTVLLTAPGGGSADELDGAGLNFGNANNTKLTVVDSGMPGMTGTVTVTQEVTLAANTTTTLNYNGGANTSDLLDVKDGTLTLAGTLNLLSNGSGKPTGALVFLDDSGAGAVMNGAFATFTGDIAGAAYAALKVVINAGLINYQVTIT